MLYCKAFLKSSSCRPYLEDGGVLRDESPQVNTLMRKTNIGAGFRGIQPGSDCLLISLDILLLRLFCRRKKKIYTLIYFLDSVLNTVFVSVFSALLVLLVKKI